MIAGREAMSTPPDRRLILREPGVTLDRGATERAVDGRGPPSRHPTSGDGPIDADAIARIRDLGDGDDALLRELIEAYIADAPARLSAVRDAIARGDAAGLARAAHGLKSSSLDMGARDVAAIAGEIEALGRGGSFDGAAALAARLDAAFERARAAFAALARSPERPS